MASDAAIRVWRFLFSIWGGDYPCSMYLCHVASVYWLPTSMQNTLLYEVFSSLSNSERKEFSKFVRSPFFNIKQPIIALHDYLALCLAHRQGPEPQAAFQAIFPDDEYEVAKIRTLASTLLAHLEHFLTYLEIFKTTEAPIIKLAEAYRKRHLEKFFESTLRESRKSLEKQPWRHAGYFEQLHLIEWEQYQYEVSGRRTDSLNIQATSDQMDTAFVARKLRLACLAISHQAVYKTDYSLGMLGAIMEAATDMLHHPVIFLYYHCYKFLTESDAAEEFHIFRAVLQAHSALLPLEELRLLYLLSINYGIKHINRSSEGWLQATLDLYKGALSLHLLIENGIFSRFAFNNIVAISLRAGEVDWAESFIHQYKINLERQWRDTTASLSLARVAYAKKDLNTALSHLQRSDYKDTMNNLTAKTLQLKIYYELRSFDALESHLKSMKTFIRRHASIGYHRNNYKLIVVYTEKLMALNFSNKKSIQTLRNKIMAESVLTEKEWLLEQLLVT